MNVLDENISIVQRNRLKGWRISVRHIGYDVGRKGMKDDEVIPFLRSLSRPTFLTLDWDYYRRNLCHARFCLVYLDVKRDEAATFIRRLLRHPDFNTQAKRMGKVIRVSQAGLAVWRLHAEQEALIDWPKR
ncbi:MAG TPA: hypothetical protein VJL59_08625 [Anaerolineales bacterium]|nr:hypothetical protein [Anaerolineales bacterium]